MKGLIYKDLIYLKCSYKQLFVSMVIAILLALYKNYIDFVLIGLPCLFSMTIIGSMQIEQANSFHNLITVSSMKYEKVVLSKYVSYVILTVLGAFICLLLCLAINFDNVNQNNTFTVLMGFCLGSGFSFLFGSTIIPLYYFFKDTKIDALLSYTMISIAILIIALLSLLKKIGLEIIMNNLDLVSYFFVIITIIVYIVSYGVTVLIVKQRGLV